MSRNDLPSRLWAGNSGLTRKLTKNLRTGRPLRKRRRRPDIRAPRFIAPATLINHRRAVVEDRSRLGDWEGDLIIGTKTRSAIGTLVDRRSGYVLLLHLPSTHTAISVNVVLTATMTQLPEKLRRTLTWGRGSEMSSHDKIASLFSDGVFFAHPGKPWQRGSNENMNGLTVLSKAQRPQHPQRQRASNNRCQAERPPAETTQLQRPRSSLRNRATIRPGNKCCDDRLNSP
jgi:IS30 family transposase